ncbi:MAG: LysR family transcriptional regulator [Planctomycetota bacterium]|nr:LysR family transcriptional regulator [Planctomycetota bacterium]
MIDLHRLAGFHLVATSGGYAKAARAADYPITQPALHQQVKKLEAEVGVELLMRVGKDTMLPTPAGERLLEFVTPFFRDLPRVVEGVRTGDYDGALTIQAESLLIRQLLPPWLVALRKRRPQAQLTLQELTTVDLSALRSGAADVVIAHLSDVPDDIASQQIATVHACLVVPKANAPRRGRPKLRDLASMPFLSYEPGTRHHALQLQAIAQHGITLTSTIALGTADTILGYVESGLGWSLVPSLDREGPKGRRLAAYPWGEPRVTFPIVMAWRKDAPEHPALDEMIACAPQP